MVVNVVFKIKGFYYAEDMKNGISKDNEYEWFVG